MGRLIKSGKWSQYFAGAVAGVSCGYCGMAYAWVSPMIVRLLSSRGDLRLSVRQTGWSPLVTEIGAIVSPLLAGWLADRVGRKTILLATAPGQALTWVAVIVISDPPTLLFVRSVQGLIMGAVQTVLPMYLTEIADNENRGRLSIMYTFGWNLGLLCEFSMRPYLGYQNVTWANMVPPLVFFFVFCCFHESPYYLVLVGKRDKAKQALESFRDYGSNCDKELQDIEQHIAEEIKTESSWKDLVKSKGGRKGLMIVLVISMTFNLCGAMSVVVYCNKTFTVITGRKLFSDVFTMVMGLVLTLVTLLTMFTVDRLGRRPVLIASYLGSSLCLLPAAVYFIVEEIGMKKLPWLGISAIIGLVAFPSFVTLGALSVVHTYQGELFTTATRGAASALVTLVGGLTSFLSLAAYLPAEKSGKDYITYCLYTAVALLGLAFCVFVAPETKGRSLEQIQEELS